MKTHSNIIQYPYQILAQRYNIAQLNAGDSDLFTAMYTLYANPLKSYLNQMVYNLKDKTREAEDFMQDAFLKLWGYREKIANFEHAEALLYKISKNLIINDTRQKRNNYKTVNISTCTSFDRSVPADRKLDEKMLLESALNFVETRLNPNQKLALEKTRIEDYPDKPVVATYGINAQTLKVSRWHAHNNLKKQFSERPYIL